MITNTARILALAAACLAGSVATPAGQAETRKTVVVKHPPVANPGDVSQSWSAQQNVIESKQYGPVTTKLCKMAIQG